MNNKNLEKLQKQIDYWIYINNKIQDKIYKSNYYL